MLDRLIKNFDVDDSALNAALNAYRSHRLELRVVVDGRVKDLSSDSTVAKQEMQALFHQGYVLEQTEQGEFYFSQGLKGGVSPIKALEQKLDLKPEGVRSIFISYQWAQKTIAVTLQKTFESKGYLVIRDEDTLANGAYIKDFMKVITHPKLDYVLTVVSASYLKSRNCMYEINQVMKRHDWVSGLLPYVVSEDPQANSHIYSGVALYRQYWQEALTNEEDTDEKEVLENIVKNITIFAKEITARINISEKELVETNYAALFDLIAKREEEKESSKFKEIEELLRAASISENIDEHNEADNSLLKAIEKVKLLRHVSGVEPIFCKVYGAYGEYLLRQNKEEEAEKQLKIASRFGYKRESSVELEQKTSASPNLSYSATSRSVSLKLPQVSSEELSQFLDLVAKGEQAQAESLLENNQDLAYVPGNVTDLSRRTFEGITALQYAIWALDVHMWEMILKYLPIEEASAQFEIFNKDAAWMSIHGRQVNWNPLVAALYECLRFMDSREWKDASDVWIHRVGREQLLLPAHVINEYCHLTRSFQPMPDFRILEKTPDWRVRQSDEGDWFTCKYKGGKLGVGFAFGRGGRPKATATYLATTLKNFLNFELPSTHVLHMRQDVAAMENLYKIRVEQRVSLFERFRKNMEVGVAPLPGRPVSGNFSLNAS